MKNIIIKITATLSILFFSLITSAQGPGGLPRDPSPIRDPQEEANIDSAIIWLIAAAVLLGAYVMLKQRKAVVK